MELMMIAFWLEVPVKPLLNSAMQSQKFLPLSGPGKHLWLLDNFWDTLENWGSGYEKNLHFLLIQKKNRQALQDFLTEFSGHDIEIIRNGVRYQVEVCQTCDPKLGIYRTPTLEIGKPLASNIGYFQHYGGLRDGIGVYIANYLREHREDPNFRWPDFMQLQATSGEMIPFLKRPTPTSIRFSSPAPFLVYQSLPSSPTPPVFSRGMELFPSSVYEILSFITSGIASPPTPILTLRVTNGSHQLSIMEGKEIDMEKLILINTLTQGVCSC